MTAEVVSRSPARDMRNVPRTSVWPTAQLSPVEVASPATLQSITDSTGWAETLREVERHDFHHTWHYHRHSLEGAQRAELLRFDCEDVLIALPLILDRIPGTMHYDATSVYGYCGPVCSQRPTPEQSARFGEMLLKYLAELRVVSLFSRLHPYIDHQQLVLAGLGEVSHIGPVVTIDLTQSPDEIRAGYGKSVKNQLNRLRRECTVVPVETDEQLIEFADIYSETMQRLDASDEYLFDADYFRALCSSSEYGTDMFLAVDNASNEAMAGALFTTTRDIVQYHLSGTREKWLRRRASKLLIDHMRLKASDDGLRYMNLGGGLGGHQDSLFEYKSSFSKLTHPFRVWRWVLNQNVYNHLSSRTEGSPDGQFFPRYRSPSGN